MNTIVQDAEKMGTALKTISARIRGVTSETDEDIEETTMTTAKLREEIKALSGVDIMLDSTTFKSTYQVLEELSKVYENLDDTAQARIAEMLGGKTGLNVVQAMLQNFDTARTVVNDINAGLAEGSANKELETALDSISGKLNQLKTVWQELSINVISSDLVKDGLDFLMKAGELVNNLVKGTSNLSSSMAGVISFVGMTGFQALLKQKTGSGRVKALTLIEYARVSSGGNTERADTMIVVSARELWKNYRTWCESTTSFMNLVRER